MSDHYVNNDMLEQSWMMWLQHGNEDDVGREAWKSVAEMVYLICFGVALRFTRDEEEREEYAHHAFALIMGKIESQKLKYEPERGKAFNFLTTAAFHEIRSLLGKQSSRKRVLARYAERKINTDRNLQEIKDIQRSRTRKT